MSTATAAVAHVALASSRHVSTLGTIRISQLAKQQELGMCYELRVEWEVT
ncbi:MAG TPA: hypothetical protein VMY18_10255 [Acidobacteriota bacterium]|nr:hypothetical protein [Acidobacteriota bacterium]